MKTSLPAYDDTAPNFFFFRCQHPGRPVHCIVGAQESFAVPRLVKRLETLFFIYFGEDTDHLLDLEDFVIDWPSPLCHDMEFGKTIRDEYRVEPFREQIDNRCAKKREAV